MTRTAPDALLVRPATESDEPAVLELLRASLGWEADGLDAALFRWKHRDNAFGRSPAWVAEAGGMLAGYRTFMRWEFLDGDRTLHAVRAVDTATHPRFRGRGIFRTLTLAAVQAMTEQGLDLVFNTPNDQSRPGYLSMGWSVVGRLPIAMLPAGPRGVARTLGARVPADLWSQPCAAGASAPDALVDDTAITHLLESLPRRSGLVTRRSPAYLRWRYGLPELHYRALAPPGGPAEGLLLFRLRRRGAATELAVVDSLTPSARTARRLVRRALRDSGADYAVALGSALDLGMVPVPRHGPLMTVRPLASPPPERWSLNLGDIELF